jgi:hypothetical protein
LIDYELRVSVDVKLLNLEVGGDAQTVHQHLALCHIVGSLEVQ